MQNVSDEFTTWSNADMRELNWQCRMSFGKEYDADITFFTIGQSLIGGNDILKGEADVVQEWDKYAYTDYTDRIIDIEITRQVEKWGSVTMSTADVTMNNYDDYFTPGAGSAIDGDILPYRPIRLYLGFGDEAIPMFIGVTDKMPEINEKEKTVKFHCIDFMFSLMNRPLLEEEMYEDSTTNTILEGLFDNAGISGVQLDLDTGLNTVSFAYFEKGEKLGNAVKKLLEAEVGRMYMDEYGTIKFRTRNNYNDSVQKTFNSYDNIVSKEVKKEDEIINVVEVKGEVREAQANQKYWELQSSVEILAGESVDIWADFNDPVTSVDSPSYITSATTSLFAVNTSSDGSGSANATDVTLTSSSRFSKSYKMTFRNSGASTLYITTIELFCQPVKKVQDIYVREQDDTSVEAYDERVLTIENEFVQTEDDATALALVILGEYADFGSLDRLDVKGTPALQIDDVIRVNLFDNIQDFRIRKVVDQISFPAQYKQLIEVKKVPDYSYFTIGVSLIGGPDVIRP